MVQRKVKQKLATSDKKNGQKQTSIFSYFSVKNRNNNSNVSAIAPVEEPVHDVDRSSAESNPQTETTEMICTPTNVEPVNVTTNLSTPVVDRSELIDSAYNELLDGLLQNSSSNESVTPHLKRSFLRNSGQRDRKRLRLTQSEEESPSQDLQLCKRVKLSQSPTKPPSPSPPKILSQSPTKLLSQSPRKRLSQSPTKLSSRSPRKRLSQSSTKLSSRSPRERLSRSPIERCSQSPTKENNVECCNVASKCSSPGSRKVLQELHGSVNSTPSSSENEIANKRCSTDDFVDIENLGDFLNEAWGEDFADNECLNLNEWQTCRVTRVEEVNDGLVVELEKYGRKIGNPVSTSCHIRGYWGDKKLECKDVVNIKAYYDESSKVWRVDHTRGCVVKHPDVLMSSTCLVGSLFCQRRAVLGYLYPGLDSKNISMLLGSLIHELLQEVLSEKIYSEREIRSLAIRMTNRPRSVVQSYEYGLASVDLEKELLNIVPEIVNFVNIYVLETEEGKMWPGKIVDVLSTEENFWLPQLGFKGKADFILRTEIENETRLMPLELKTGRASNSIEHRAQIILYLMMMAEVGMEADSGLLLYLKHNILRDIKPYPTEKQGLVTTRNNLVDYYAANDSCELSKGETFTPTLPEPINHHIGCARCPYLTICSAHLKRENEPTLADNNPLKKLSESALAHLSPAHIEYVFHWTSLLKLEEMERKTSVVAKVSDIWRLSSEEREKRGYCVSKLVIKDVTKQENKYVHLMERSQNPPFDLTKSGLMESDYIVVSTDSRVAVASGYVQSISTNSIHLKFDRMLNSSSKELLFTVDKYSVSETLLAFNTSSLFALLEDSERATRMRRLIVDMQLPLFGRIRDVTSNVERSILCKLNQYQREAVLKTLTAEDYLLIKGLPGTGKTATIVALVRLLVQQNHTVLITSHTHSAVDNILLRLKGHVDFLRLGSKARVHRELTTYCEDFKIENENIHTVEQLELLYNQQMVIAVTCMGCSHSLLSKRSFDYCIVDEATQVLQPSILRSLFSARKFVLVGDPNQLPPVVQSRKASELGFDESLFVKLDRAEVTCTLYLQYRMNANIMNLANSFAYNNQLRCDNEDVRCATIKMLHRPKTVVSWLDRTLSSDINDSIIFLNTSKLPNIQYHSEYANSTEANITFKIVESLSQDIEDIGVIAPFREQIKLLQQMADERQYHDIEINTVDQYQGRDKDVIIYSCTKHSNKKEGGILADKRRLTVAITRAKRKLIIIGHVPVLKKYPVFEELINLIPRNNLIDVLSVKF